MKKINILSKNEAFADDIKHQIELSLAAEITKDIPDENTSLILVDEDLTLLSQTSENLKDLPVVLFSSHQDTEENADLVIKKPFKLESVLASLKNDTLIPKVRRKECLIIKDYSFYPVKKEIISSITHKVCKLTEKEVDIIKYLYQTKPQISSKEDLLENVWKYSTDATTHTVETHIYRLRQKVEKEGKTQLIITENNGYRLNI